VGDNVLVEIARGINSATRLADQNGMAAVGGGAPTRLKRLWKLGWSRKPSMLGSI
jgi:hypothetical protein